MAETITRLSGQGSNGSSSSYSLLQPGTALPTGAFRLSSFFWYGTGTVTVPSSWTPILSPVSVLGGLLGCYYHIHTAGEGTYTFTKSATGGFVGRITNLSGVDPDNPVDVEPVVTSQGGSTINVYNNVPQLTTVTPGAWVWWWLVAGLVATASRTFNLGAGGWTQEAAVVWPTTQGLNGLGGYQEFETPAATGARTATYSLNTPFRGFALALRPAGSGGGAARTNDHFHTLAHHEPDRPGELWTPPDRQLHRPRRRRVFDLGAVAVAA